MGNIKRFILLVIMLVIYSCKPREKTLMPSLVETYSKDDAKPFGGYVAYHHFKQLLNDRYIETRGESFDDTWKWISDTSRGSKHSLYILLTRNLIVSESEASALYEYVNEGNDLLIGADYIDNNLLSKISCLNERDSELVAEMSGIMKPAQVHLKSEGHDSVKIYTYYYYPFLNAFYGYDTLETKVLGFNQVNKPNFLVLFIGKGRLYLNSAPRLFSNYFLLKDDNYLYLDNVFSYLRPDPKDIYWDEYYKKHDSRRKRTYSRKGSGSGSDNDHFSSFDVINKSPLLRTALWLTLLLLLLYIAFNIKRKQRPMKEIRPNVNSSLVFTETVGRLYLQKKDNKNVSEKMITYFYEHIRGRYFLNTTKIDNEFIASLSRKSGYDQKATEELFTTIAFVQNQDTINDMALLSLNEKVQNFYKNKH